MEYTSTELILRLNVNVEASSFHVRDSLHRSVAHSCDTHCLVTALLYFDLNHDILGPTVCFKCYWTQLGGT